MEYPFNAARSAARLLAYFEEIKTAPEFDYQTDRIQLINGLAHIPEFVKLLGSYSVFHEVESSRKQSLLDEITSCLSEITDDFIYFTHRYSWIHSRKR